ncbi:MAG: DNA repair protein RadA, partial [Deltaproteobacteria bacterium]|nr:DNA repair protein RadA [Deltaproteobacteria bacterium]
GAVVAIASSFLDRPVDHKMVVFGEVGLAGEVRGVNQVDIRLTEAARLGFTRCLLSRNNLDQAREGQVISLTGVSNLQEVLENVF